MPTTRRRRRRLPNTAPLSLALVDFLLDGRTRNPDDVPEAEREHYDGFVMFDPWTPEQIDALWRQHGNFLRAEAERRRLAASAKGAGA
jgi:hypothetical protein